MDRLTNRRIDLSTLSDRVQKRREALKLDQEAVADRAGVSSAYVSRLERGAVPNPKVFDLEKVAFALETTVAALLTTDDPPGREIRVNECADILGQLDGEPPEVADTILRWLRESVEIARTARLARTN